MTLQDFKNKWIGQKADFDGFYGGQCVDLFRFYCQEVLNIPQAYPVISDTTKGRGACDFWLGFDSSSQLKDNFTQIKNTADFKPIEGDVMVWNRKAGGGHGHIAICTGKNTDLNKFESFDQNWSKISLCEIVSHPYTNVYGVLRPKKSAETTITIPTSERDNLIERSTRLDAFEKAGYPDAQSVTLSIETYIDRINTIKNGFDDFLREMVTILDPNTVIEIADQDLVKNLAKKVVSDFSSVQSELLKKEKQWQQQEKALEDENLELEKQVGSLRQEVERLLKRIDRVETDLQTYKDKKAENDKFYGFIETIKRLFERTK